MDDLIARVALLLMLPMSTVCGMQATDVLAHCAADTRREHERRTQYEFRAVFTAKLTNLAVLKPEALQRLEDDMRRKSGQAAATPAAAEAMFASMPLQESL